MCNEKFKTHKQLKAHIQKKCKSKNLAQSKQTIVHKHNEDILPEDEHKCPHCPKITNNQVSIVNHVNSVHKAIIEKCDSCGQTFTSREDLVKHIVDKHTDIGVKQTQQGRWEQVGGNQPHRGQGGQQQQETSQWIQRLKCQSCAYETNTQNELEFRNESMHHELIARHWCYRCNIEVNWDKTVEKHICRMPNYDPENKCNFCKVDLFSSVDKQNHVCEEHPNKTVDQQRKEIKRKNTECTHGVHCFRAAKN